MENNTKNTAIKVQGLTKTFVNNSTRVEVLRESNVDTKLMTKGGVVAGCIMLAVAAAALIIAFAVHLPATVSEYNGEVFNDMNNTILGLIFVTIGTIFLSVAAAKFGCLYLPMLGFLIIKPFARFVSGNLTGNGIITSKRRTTSLVSPIIVSVSIIVVMSFIMEGFLFALSQDVGGADIPPLGLIMIILAIPSITFTTISVVNTQIMAYSVRKNDIAVMRLLGVSKSQIILTAVWEPLVIAVLGIATGLGIAFLGANIFSNSIARDFGAIPFSVPWKMMTAMILIYLAAAITGAVVSVAKILNSKQQKVSSFC